MTTFHPYDALRLKRGGTALKHPKSMFLAALTGIVLLAAGCGSSPSQATTPNTSSQSVTTLNETGSTLLYPLFNIWAKAYHRTHPDIKISTGDTGSGTGIASAVAGTVEIGASDAYMTTAQIKQATGTILNIPLAISAQVIAYNVPGLSKQLVLSGPVIAGIYSGTITNWNDPKIRALNPGVTLPDLAITPIHRSDGSGDSFIFTQYLSYSTPSWMKSVGFSTSPNFPAVKRAVGAEGTSGELSALAATKGGITYAGTSYLSEIKSNHLAYALLVNKAGNAVDATLPHIEAAAAAKVPDTPTDERISLIFAPGANAYPIINYEYAVVKADQPSAATASALRAFLKWIITSGNSSTYLNQVGFMPLPSSVVAKSQAQIDKIK